MSDDKPHEFWINKGSYDGDTGKDPFYSCVLTAEERAEGWCNTSHFIHVVEYKAYEELRESLKKTVMVCAEIEKQRSESQPEARTYEAALAKTLLDEIKAKHGDL